MALPIPKGRQREVLALRPVGHNVILGTAGSGKTTLAILRAAYLAAPGTAHGGRTLLLSFNRALVTYLQHLGNDVLGDVIIETYHTFARGYLDSRGLTGRDSICSADLRRRLVEEALNAIRGRNPGSPIVVRPTEFFLDEIQWIAQHGITEFDDYRDVERAGQRVRLDRLGRRIVWDMRDEYLRRRAAVGKGFDWDDLASSVSASLEQDEQPRRYRHIVIDEGQDFSPAMIRSLATAAAHDGSVTFFGDVAQQIYGHHGVSWRSAGLSIRQVIEFRENYRNTRQVARLALAISSMPYYKLTPDLVEPNEPTADGPLPTVVRFQSVEDEIAFVAEQAERASRTQSVGVLYRLREHEKTLPASTRRNAPRLHRDMSLWPVGAGVRYGTYHAAKGLEFDSVILPFCSPEYLLACHAFLDVRMRG